MSQDVKSVGKIVPEPNAEATGPFPDRLPTPFADRAIAILEDCVRSAKALLVKADTYHDPRAKRDMDPSVEANLRLQVRTLTQMLDQINCPPAYIPELAKHEPVRFGDASRQEAEMLKAKTERAKAINSIPMSTAARAKAQANEAAAMIAAKNYEKGK